MSKIEHNIRKGELLQRSGELKKRAYHVKKGLLRSFQIDLQGKEHTFMFAPEGWLLADPEPNVNNNPSELFIEAMEDSVIVIVENPRMNAFNLSKEELNEALNPTLKRMAVLQHRVLSLMSATSIERYNDFIATYPNIADRIPQHMIASYLGITPEALSRAKKQFEKNRPLT